MMNTLEKEKVQNVIVGNIKGIESVIAAAVKSKNEAYEKIDHMRKHGADSFKPEYLEREIQKLTVEYSSKRNAYGRDIDSRLDSLLVLFHNRDAVLDLGNPALSNALALIQAIGGNLSDAEAKKINANFIHDQSALSAIRAAYAAHGVVNMGNIDALIYNADNEISTLKELAYAAFIQEGSINIFASRLAILATLEGTTVEAMPDEIGAMAAMRRAAGLPV